MGQKSPIYKHCHFAVIAPKRNAARSNRAGDAKSPENTTFSGLFFLFFSLSTLLQPRKHTCIFYDTRLVPEYEFYGNLNRLFPTLQYLRRAAWLLWRSDDQRWPRGSVQLWPDHLPGIGPYREKITQAVLSRQPDPVRGQLRLQSALPFLPKS